MAVSITIPTPPAAGQPLVMALGKYSRDWPTTTEAVAWASDLLGDGGERSDFLFALAILLAARRPATRGLPLTVNFSAAQNLVRLT
jgi:hypothetical protein